MRSRLTEALRRAEIMGLINDARSVAELGEQLADELTEAFEAEIAFVFERSSEQPSKRWQVVASVGPSAAELAVLLASAQRLEDVGAGATPEILDPASIIADLDLIDGAMHALLCAIRAGGVSILFGVVRLYDEPLIAAERALLESVCRSAAHAFDRLRAIEERNLLFERTRASFRGTAEALANALEAKDGYTADHARAIAELAVSVGRQLGMNESELEDLRYGAIFHDIGKIAVPDSILNKPGPLTEAEFAVIKRHPTAGERILAPIPFLSDRIRKTVRHDHERWDGGGYPDGLCGEQIPIEARIVFVVDAYHAMTSDRPYRQAMATRQAREELTNNAGSQFDPTVVDAFLSVLGDPDSSRPRP